MEGSTFGGLAAVETRLHFGRIFDFIPHPNIIQSKNSSCKVFRNGNAESIDLLYVSNSIRKSCFEMNCPPARGGEGRVSLVG
jgi:hypothetical protein